MLSTTLRPLIRPRQSNGVGSIAMSLSTWEQQVLDSIRDHLASSHPTLAARLAIFTRLASDEEMPAREKIQADSRPVRRPSARPRLARRVGQRLGFQRAALLLWLVTTVALISVALVVSHTGTQSTCTGSWSALCTGTASAPKAASPIP
jgi:hypothetical protein